MKVTFLGTGAGANYRHDRGGSCVLVETGDSKILVDCGPGSVRQLMLAGHQPGSIDTVLITHLHFDHALGLAELFNRLGRTGSQPPRIIGPPDVEQYVENCKRLVTLSSVGTKRELPENLAAIRGETAVPGANYSADGIEMEAIDVPHSADVNAMSWKIESDGRILVVSGDVHTDESFMSPFAKGADLLIHEAYSENALDAISSSAPTKYMRERVRTRFPETHSEVSTVAAVARAAGAKRLALTHLLPDEDEDELVRIAKTIYGGEVLAARVGESIEL